MDGACDQFRSAAIEVRASQRETASGRSFYCGEDAATRLISTTSKRKLHFEEIERDFSHLAPWRRQTP